MDNSFDENFEIIKVFSQTLYDNLDFFDKVALGENPTISQIYQYCYLGKENKLFEDLNIDDGTRDPTIGCDLMDDYEKIRNKMTTR